MGVSVASRSFKTMQALKGEWAVGDECVPAHSHAASPLMPLPITSTCRYSCPGPIQFHGSAAALIPRTLSTDHAQPAHCQEICSGPLLSTKFLTGTPAASSIVT
jgi:hypothetical protein